MVFADMLVILIVQEGGLRSTLAARLALSGVDVVSMNDADSARVARLGGTAAVLVADEAALQCHPGGLDALACDPVWQHLLILGGEPRQGLPAHVQQVGVDACVDAITALPHWKAVGARASARPH